MQMDLVNDTRLWIQEAPQKMFALWFVENDLVPLQIGKKTLKPPGILTPYVQSWHRTLELVTSMTGISQA